MSFANREEQQTASNFISDLEAFSLRIMGLPVPKIDPQAGLANPAQKLYGINGEDFIKHNTAIQSLATQDPVIAKVAAKEFKDRKRKLSKMEVLNSSTLRRTPTTEETAFAVCEKRYKKFFDAVFALSDIYEGALHIDQLAVETKDWSEKCARFDARIKSEILAQAPKLVVEIKADILAEKQMTAHSLGDWLAKASSTDAYTPGSPITEALIDDYMHSDDYSHWRDNQDLTARRGIIMTSNIGGQFQLTKRLSNDKVLALLAYGRPPGENEIISQEITTFVRTHRRDIELLASILRETEKSDAKAVAEKPRSARPIIHAGIPADWFLEAKTQKKTPAALPLP